MTAPPETNVERAGDMTLAAIAGLALAGFGIGPADLREAAAGIGRAAAAAGQADAFASRQHRDDRQRAARELGVQARRFERLADAINEAASLGMLR